LFGARRGAYSGADANAEGYIQAASGGTLFLDEIGDLDLHIQAKLLRVIETRELLPLGAARPHTVDLQVCSATNKDLKALAALGRFREDLYYRIGRPIVSIPPLRKRPEEVPFLIEAALKRTTIALAVHVSLVEVCVLRPWPGNIRELLVEIRSAAQTAASQTSSRIDARHLAPGAGTVLRAPSENAQPDFYTDATPSPMPTKRLDPAEHTRLEAALRCHHGNVSGAARALGLHRTQLRRLLERHGIDPQRFAEGAKQQFDLDET
jgi:transcriptional regulator with GAF, ATPase, and Fis domain